ncbi:efflux RND transporter permease subunit, partial [bacterium]|nr:efflux RND transporter permease subunit [bacterium]
FPLESTFNSLPHVRRVRSNSALGISLIHVEFEYGTNIYFARQLVSEKLQLTAGQMPEGTIPPFVGPISSMFADAIEFTISGENLYDSRDFAEWTLRPRLQTVPGVSNVINFGGLLKQYQVQLDPNQLRYYAITVREVVNALESNNANATGGYLLNGPEEKLIRSMGQIRSIADIENIVLKQHSGIPVYIKNVAKVEVGPFVRRGTAGENGTEVVAVTVQNQYGANVLKTIKGVEQVIDDVKQRVAGKFELEVFYTQLTMILKALQNVRGAIFAGAFLVILVLFLFMNNLRSTLLVSMSIPLSSIIAIIFFKLFGLTLNIMTLGGLALGAGMLVDNAIVVVDGM